MKGEAMSTEPEYGSEAEVLARLDELRAQRAEHQTAAKAALNEIKDVLRIAGGMRFGGQPINRSLLIKRSGLSRRTAYQVLPPEEGD
jgi:hypothetical protein